MQESGWSETQGCSEPWTQSPWLPMLTVSLQRSQGTERTHAGGLSSLSALGTEPLRCGHSAVIISSRGCGFHVQGP